MPSYTWPRKRQARPERCIWRLIIPAMATMSVLLEPSTAPAIKGINAFSYLVRRFSQIDGYRCLSLIRALAVVNCQSALA